ncbi:hypothetical protein TI04_05695, partial [Achromatium sp. WMS2]
MRLRTQVWVFLLIFALTPLITVVVINVPVVFDNIELFYQKAHQQNLQAIFFDLDKHLVNRQELLRLLSNLPEPGLILSNTSSQETIDVSRVQYTKWINQIFPDQRDISQIIFLDNKGQESFWLERDKTTHEWHPTTNPPDRPAEDFMRAADNLEPGRVLRSYIRLDPKLGTKNIERSMVLHLITKVFVPTKGQITTVGSVVMTLDIGGIAQSYPGTIWVNSTGSYITTERPYAKEGQAFKDYPGLQNVFVSGTELWKGNDGKQILWRALFPTENAGSLWVGYPTGSLWVGYPLEPEPIIKFRDALAFRVMIVVLLLVALVLAMAQWITTHLERWGDELTAGIANILKGSETVAFNWRGPREVKALAQDLTNLARSHATYARELEETNRYKTEFLANMSHELRTPLNSILLLSKLLAEPDSSLTPEQIKQARVIHRAGCDLQDLIENLLDHARIEARETALYLEWLEIKPLVEQLVDLLRPQLLQKNLHNTITISP